MGSSNNSIWTYRKFVEVHSFIERFATLIDIRVVVEWAEHTDILNLKLFHKISNAVDYADFVIKCNSWVAFHSGGSQKNWNPLRL